MKTDSGYLVVRMNDYHDEDNYVVEHCKDGRALFTELDWRPAFSPSGTDADWVAEFKGQLERKVKQQEFVVIPMQPGLSGAEIFPLLEASLLQAVAYHRESREREAQRRLEYDREQFDRLKAKYGWT